MGIGLETQALWPGQSPILEWCDPLSGLWHRQDAALRLAQVRRAIESLRR